jgi:hypothetical protein
MEAGFFQEQAALQRVLDEIAEDISFLSFAVILDDITPLHVTYLEAFFKEEFNQSDVVVTSSERAMVPRKKIRAYLDRASNGPKGSSKQTDAARTVSKTYSGYIHAASPQIMDMYGGNPLRFHMQGMLGTPRHAEHQADIWNYFYRSVIAFAIAAKAFGDDELFASIRNFSEEFLSATGNDYQSNEW